MTKSWRISARSLAEYVYRSGSIESGFAAASSMAEGTKAHRKIQGAYKEEDEHEVFLKEAIQHEEIEFLLEGRCDGIINEEGDLVIDEIKSTAKDLSAIDEDTHPVHWAQARCYAYMLAKERGLKRITVQLTYLQIRTEEEKRFRKAETLAFLEDYVKGLIADFYPYARLMLSHREKRDSSIKALPFPFPDYRKGQRKLAKAVYKSILDEKDLFAQAPTGTGKTISTSFPAIKAMGEGLLSRIVYLTAKTITRQAAEEAFSMMKQKGLHMHTVTITAKDKICFQEQTVCRKEHCPFADGFYDRINEAVLDILSHETTVDRTVIEKYAMKHTVCPFEFSLELAYAADSIICDYNYIFDPRVSLKRLHTEGKKKTALLIDEAHNLVDRAREMFSAGLGKQSFLQLKRTYKNTAPQLYAAAKRMNDVFISYNKELKEESYRIHEELPENLLEHLEEFALCSEKELISGRGDEGQELLLDTYFSVQAFLRISRLADERFVIYTEKSGKDVVLKLFCLDSSYLVQKMGKGFRSKLFFSATFQPFDYFKTMLGWNAENYSLSLPSPFPKENAEVLALPLSTRYRDRGATGSALITSVERLTAERPGNYLMFFPSYQYMREIHEQMKDSGNIRMIVQEQGMTEGEREEFLASFEENPAESLLGFAVLGGIFSEGINLKGTRLGGVIIVGVGLPQLSLERNLIKDHFQSAGKNGYDYAYTFPGANKAAQAGGRLIRSEEDTGTILLIDDRFLQKRYEKLLPAEWFPLKRLTR